MSTPPQKTILEYWNKYIINADPLIVEWLDKENIYLKNEIKKGSVVLDVGCGMGPHLELLESIVDHIVGIDNNEILLPITRQNLSKFNNVDVLNSDARQMPFEDYKFDFCICMGNTFGDFAENQQEVLKEMKRVTKKNGNIIISVYSENALDIRLKEYARIGIRIKNVDDGIVYTEDGLTLEQFKKQKIDKLFNSVGLDVIVESLSHISYICQAKNC